MKKYLFPIILLLSILLVGCDELKNSETLKEEGKLIEGELKFIGYKIIYPYLNSDNEIKLKIFEDSESKCQYIYGYETGDALTAYFGSDGNVKGCKDVKIEDGRVNTSLNYKKELKKLYPEKEDSEINEILKVFFEDGNVSEKEFYKKLDLLIE